MFSRKHENYTGSKIAYSFITYPLCHPLKISLSLLENVINKLNIE